MRDALKSLKDALFGEPTAAASKDTKNPPPPRAQFDTRGKLIGTFDTFHPSKSATTPQGKDN